MGLMACIFMKLEEIRKILNSLSVIANVKIPLLLDTEANVSVLKAATDNAQFCHYPLQVTLTTLIGYSNTHTSLLGKGNITCHQNKHLGSFAFYVTESGMNLLGVDFFQALGFKVQFKYSNIPD